MSEKNKKPTMKEIAKKIGVSINAVSIVLNGRKGVSQEVKNKIFRYANEIGYFENKPKYINKLASNTLCLFSQTKYINDFCFYSIIINEIKKEVKKMGYDFLTICYDEYNFKVPECITNGKVSGIFMLGTISDDYLEQILNYKIPIVLVDNISLKYNIDCLINSNKSGSYKATKFLFDNNIFDIGFFGDILYSQSIKERFYGMQEAMLEIFNFDYKKMIYFISECSILNNIENDIIEKNIKNIKDKLQELYRIPKAFVCSNDNAAKILINALNALNYKVPEDVSVIGFDNNEFSDIFRPSITTVDINKEVMGKQSVKRLIFRIKNKWHPAEIIVLETNLIIRNSVLLAN